MSDDDRTTAEGPHEDKQRLDSEIEKAINKLKYFLKERDVLIHLKDYTEIEILTKRAENIFNKLLDLNSQTEELK